MGISHRSIYVLMSREHLSDRGILRIPDNLRYESMAELMSGHAAGLGSILLRDPGFLGSLPERGSHPLIFDRLYLLPGSPIMASEERQGSQGPAALPVELRARGEIIPDRLQSSRRESDHSGLISLPDDHGPGPVEVDIRADQITGFGDPEPGIRESKDKGSIPESFKIPMEPGGVFDQPIDSLLVVLYKSLLFFLSVPLS